MKEQKTGVIVSVMGSVVDVQFDPETMPLLLTALHIERENGAVLTLEVVQLL